MEYLVAGLALVAAVTVLNVVLTLALVHRWRARMSGPPDAHHHSPELGIAPGDRMPGFTAITADGTTVTRDELAGRPVLIAFLSLDCEACDSSVPEFGERARRVRDAGGLVLATVVGVDAAESELVARLVDLVDHVVPEFLDSPVGALFGVRFYPGFAYYDPDGIATATSIGLQGLGETAQPLVP
ncbi:redoxin domain-containing protein [Nonomuraea sp. NPDC005650]|uniref:peroxiredoxin family protein n=1 Tax=Nonomuraea sp. NPDC005650 TaxID=3157045 RepID=UPI0033BDA5F6